MRGKAQTQFTSCQRPQVVNVQLDSEDQTDGGQAASDDQSRRERFSSKAVKNEFLDAIGQRLAFPEDIPSTVEKDMTHPSVAWNSERGFVPVHLFEITGDAILLQYREWSLGPSHDGVSAEDRLERCLVLDREEGLDAEVSLFPELGDIHSTSV